MKLIDPIFTMVLLMATMFTRGQDLAHPILLWPDGAPNATGTSDEDKPAIIPFIPEASKRNGAAVPGSLGVFPYPKTKDR